MTLTFFIESLMIVNIPAGFITGLVGIGNIIEYDSPNDRPLSPNCVAISHRTDLYVGFHVLFVSRSAFRVGT